MLFFQKVQTFLGVMYRQFNITKCQSNGVSKSNQNKESDREKQEPQQKYRIGKTMCITLLYDDVRKVDMYKSI